MKEKLLNADGLMYIGLKAGRDFIMVLAATVGADTFTNTPSGWGVALAAAGSTTVYRLVRYALDRFSFPI